MEFLPKYNNDDNDDDDDDKYKSPDILKAYLLARYKACLANKLISGQPALQLKRRIVQ